jgi:glycosyltransferase involved in cell wall biosynthesis
LRSSHKTKIAAAWNGGWHLGDHYVDHVADGDDVLTCLSSFGRRAGCTRVRLFDWLDVTGIDADLGGYVGLQMGSARELLRHPVALVRAEVATRSLARKPIGRLFLQREASPLGRGGLEARVLRRAELAVYDFDDALQHDRGHGPASRAFPKADKVAAACRSADRVIAGNAYLADYAAQTCDDVRVIPSCVRPELYTAKATFSVGDPPTVVWVGSRSTEPYLVGIADAMIELHRRTGARLLVISEPSGDLGPLDPIAERVPWVEGLAESILAEADLGVMPLPDSPYNRGKCGYKLLQYGAAALPMVGSPVGVNREILAATSMPAPTGTEDWVDAMQALLGLPETSRAELGLGARSVIERDYSFDAWRDRWMQAVGATE